MQSDGGASTIAHPTLRGQGVYTEVSRQAVEATQDSLLGRRDLQGSQGSLAELGSRVQGPVFMLQQNIHSERCLLGSQTVNEHGCAVEVVMKFAEGRHHEDVANAACVGGRQPP